MSSRAPRLGPRWGAAAPVLAAAFLLAGCGTTAATVSSAASPAAVETTSALPDPSPTDPASTPAAATSAAPSGSQPTAAAAATSSMAMPPPPTNVPSAAAQMICSAEVGDDIATMLQLHAAPEATSSYINQRYTCTYHLSDGPLVLSVQDTTGAPAARSYFESLRQATTGSQTLTGLPALGLPAFQTPTGTVAFLKDDKTLQVDATALPPTLGPNHQTRNDVAYQIATDVIGCWRGQ